MMQYWIVDSIFYVFRVNNGIDQIDTTYHNKSFDTFTKQQKYFITGESDRKLLEFWELKEARTNAKQAFIMALAAILISVIGIAIEIILSN